MRKIIFVSVVSIIFLSVSNIVYGETLPEKAKEIGLKAISFNKPIETYLDSPRRWEKFLLVNGYLVAKKGKTIMYFIDTPDAPYGQFSPTQKMLPFMNEDGRFSIAKYQLKSIDKVEKLVRGDYDIWRFSFTYYAEPLLPELPKLGPFKGSTVAAFNRWNERWGETLDLGYEQFLSLYVGENYFKESGDIKEIYEEWLRENSQKWEGKTTTLPTKLSQPPGQIPTPAETAPEKITIDSLTKSLPYGDYNAGESQAMEKTYNVSFDDAWNAANKVISGQKEAITTSDRNKGILIGQGEGMSVIHWTAAIIEKITEYSVKITVKNVGYRGDIVGPYVGSYSSIIHKNLEKELKSKVKQPPYFVTIGVKEYKIGGDIFTGKKEGRVFKDEKDTVVRDLALAKKIAQAAWVYENVVKAPGLPGSKRVSAILETHKRLRQYELAQGILARASVQILAATISGGATLTYTVPAGLTWRVVRDQFVNLKGLLSLTGRQGLEEALSKYQQIESSIANLKPNSIDEVTTVEIRRLYEPAHGLELSCGALLTSLMPKRGRQLLEKALKDIGDELVRTLSLSDEALTTREVLELQGKIDDALKSIPALKEYYEKLDLAKRLKEANEQVVTAWAEQAVGYKE